MRRGVRLASAASAATSGLRMYWGTAVIAAATGTVALAAVLPVTLLAGRGSALGGRLAMLTARSAELGAFLGADAIAPADTQARAVALLFGALLLAAAATFAVAAVSVLAVSAGRAGQRETEVAVRRAVGASRGSLLQSALLEGLMVAAGVVLLGVTAGAGIAHAAAAGWPAALQDGSVVPSIAAVAAMSVGLVLGALFALVSARSRGLVETNGRPFQLHVAALQLATSLVVLTAGTLLARRATAPATTPATGVLLSVTSPQRSEAERAAALTSMLGAMHQAAPDARVSLASPGAHLGLGTVGHVMTDCGDCIQSGFPAQFQFAAVTHSLASADTFGVLGLRLLAGRLLTERDDWTAPRVAVVSRTLARRHFQHGEPVGRRLRLQGGDQPWYTIVGVVDEAAPIGFGGGLQPVGALYLSTLQHPLSSVEVLVRDAATPAIDGARLAAMAPSGSSVARRDFASVAGAERAVLAWFGRWLAVEGWAMLLIAAIGTFVLMQLWVLSLHAEIGVRRAVGARHRHVLAHVLPRAGAAGAGGVLLALWVGPAMWEALGSVAGGLPPWDGWLFASYAALLSAIAVIGALLPTWAALRAAPARLVAAAE